MDITFTPNKNFVIPDPWECIKCAMCCKRWNPKTKQVDTCQYLGDDDLCTIYEDRPIACRLDYMSDSFKTMHCNMSITSIQLEITLEEIIDVMQKIGTGEIKSDG